MEHIELLNAEYYPDIPKKKINERSKYKFSLKDLSGLGSGFSVVAAAVAEAAMKAPSNEGLYRCVFPEGVAGSLASFKAAAASAVSMARGSSYPSMRSPTKL